MYRTFSYLGTRGYPVALKGGYPHKKGRYSLNNSETKQQKRQRKQSKKERTASVGNSSSKVLIELDKLISTSTPVQELRSPRPEGDPGPVPFGMTDSDSILTLLHRSIAHSVAKIREKKDKNKIDTEKTNH